MIGNIFVRCNFEGGAPDAERCFSARLVELIDPLLEQPPEFRGSFNAQQRAHRVRAHSPCCNDWWAAEGLYCQGQGCRIQCLNADHVWQTFVKLEGCCSRARHLSSQRTTPKCSCTSQWPRIFWQWQAVCQSRCNTTTLWRHIWTLQFRQGPHPVVVQSFVLGELACDLFRMRVHLTSIVSWSAG